MSDEKKTSGFTYTEEQKKVINLRDRNILVSAAAGSGKTTVLVERIIRLISDKEQPVDIDRLLIVTFTNAAAAQMREKIAAAITKGLKADPFNAHLQKQATLLHNAQITTIHSFCLFLIRNNFNDIGLDPGFRVADEGEIKLMKQEVMDQLLEERFSENQEDFTALADRFITGNSMKGLTEMIQALYTHAQAYPFPIDWLCEREADYALEEWESIEQTEWMQFLISQTKQAVAECLRLIEKARECAETTGGPYMYLPALLDDKTWLESLKGCDTYGDFAKKIGEVSFTRLSVKRDENVFPESREEVKAFRDLYKSMITDIKKRYYTFSKEKLLSGMHQNKGLLKTLIQTVILFDERFREAKREKKLIDFSDMEHLALNILLHKEGKEYIPTAAALDYRNYFYEIMIDEYQDSNLVQECILKTISGEDNGHFNRFMVGDVKQSIYKFRLACPALFMEKYATYQKENASRQRIDLSKNYRSRMEVVDSVNHIFKRIMDQKLGDITYDEDSALHCGASYQETAENYKTELLLIEKQMDNTSKQEQEARVIAGKIKEMVGSFSITGEGGVIRKAKYQDIVILLRTNSGWDEIFKKTLEEEGIPAYISARTGYFAANEIRILMNFLRVLDNPRQDIALYGVLTSAIAEFHEEDVAAVSLFRGNDLYDKLMKCAVCEETDLDSEQLRTLQKSGMLPKEKCIRFMKLFLHYRSMVSYTPIHKLLRHFLADTGFLYKESALPGGEQRRANILMLLKKAENYEKSSYSGLFYFIRYMEQLQKYEVDYGEAGMFDENSNVVRIMSIHKSKGLEFPICFVAGLSKQFNKSDMKESVICDTDFGIGMDYVDSKRRVKYVDLCKKVIAEKIRLDALSEEMRVLYVAMTRAKEKLILSAVVDDFMKLYQNVKVLRHRCEEIPLPLSLRSQAGSFLQMILPCVAFSDTLSEEPENREDLSAISIQLINENMMVEKKIHEHISDAEKKQRFLNDISQKLLENKTAAIAKQLQFSYQHENLKELYNKTTVSELKLAAMQEKLLGKDTEEKGLHLFADEKITPTIPRFAEAARKVSGSERGSAYHHVMELLDFAAVIKITELNTRRQEISNQLLMLENDGKITRDEIEMVDYNKIENFFLDCRAPAMAAAQNNNDLYKEQPFVLGVSADRLSKVFPGEETVLIQGIIDLYYVDEGQVVLLDYKTDVVKEEKELIDRYETQLQYYQESIERITGYPVKEKLIYSFCLAKMIIIQ